MSSRENLLELLRELLIFIIGYQFCSLLVRFRTASPNYFFFLCDNKKKPIKAKQNKPNHMALVRASWKANGFTLNTRDSRMPNVAHIVILKLSKLMFLIVGQK